MLYKLLATVIGAFGVIVALVALGTYTDSAPPKSTRSVAITPVAILSAVILLIGAVDGPAGALFAIIFFSAIYIIGYIANGFSTRPD